MPLQLTHDLRFQPTQDSRARQDYVSTLRGFILNDLADALRSSFTARVEPELRDADNGRAITQDDIHSAMRTDDVFQLYSAARYNAQEMSWRSVIPDIARNIDHISATAERLSQSPAGSLTLDPDLSVPENVAELDVHLMPGGYVSHNPLLSGAIYDNGLTVFTAGMVGPNIDDIGRSMAEYVRHRFPDLNPARILDSGCTVGHHSVPWKQVFPDAEVNAVDVSGSMLRYAHARAESLGVAINFHQMDATALRFPDESFDIMFSSQFLHELSLDGIARYFAEAHRVLKPGGLLLSMELPPNRFLEPYDQFYLDWDAYYNREPYYRQFRDADVLDLIVGTGFTADNYFHFTVPQFFTMSEDAFKADVGQEHRFDDKIGRMSSDFRYFGFGLWK